MNHEKLVCFSVSVTSSLASYLQSRLEPTREEHLKGFDLKSKLIASPEKVRLRKKWLTVRKLELIMAII
jgi:hypothetical protein